MKHLAVLGWYNKRNLGDELLQASLSTLLNGYHLVFWGYTPPVGVLNHFDYIIVGGGSLWPTSDFFTQYGRIRKGLKRPFSLVGISAKTDLDRRRTEEVLGRADVVIVRDGATRQVMYDHPKVIVAPDLTWLEPQGFIEKPTSKGRIGLNLRHWPNEGPSHSEEIVSVVGDLSAEILPVSFYEGSGWDSGCPRDRDVMKRAGVEGPYEVPQRVLPRIRIMVGMRYHSLVLSAQAGIPFVGFDYHPKTRAFLREAGLGDYCVPLGDSKALADAIRRALGEYEVFRERLRKLRNQYSADALRIYGAVRERIDSLLASSQKGGPGRRTSWRAGR